LRKEYESTLRQAAAIAQLEDVVIEKVGPGGPWAFRIRHGDDLGPLQDALKRLEQLKKEGKLSPEIIQKEVAKAMEKMKAQPTAPTFEKPIRIELKSDAEGKLMFLREVEGKLHAEHLAEALKHFAGGKDKSYDQAVRELLELLHKQKSKNPGVQWEVIP